MYYTNSKYDSSTYFDWYREAIFKNPIIDEYDELCKSVSVEYRENYSGLRTNRSRTAAATAFVLHVSKRPRRRRPEANPLSI